MVFEKNGVLSVAYDKSLRAEWYILNISENKIDIKYSDYLVNKAMGEVMKN